MERHGGFAGISQYNEMNTDDLPSSLKTRLNRLVSNATEPCKSVKSVPKGAADHYSYRITIDYGDNQRVIEGNQYDMQDSWKPIISYVEKRNKEKVN